MAWQRKIPFGYMIRDGLAQPQPQEADAVRFIFGQYQAGASLLAIAEEMTRQGVHYHQHTTQWNKNMVKRILENVKYTGADGWFPMLTLGFSLVNFRGIISAAPALRNGG